MVKTTQRNIALHLDVLPRATKRAFVFLSNEPWLRRSAWYLAGGTALALFEGHRQSLDLDFFSTEKTFRPETVLRHLPEVSWETNIAREGTIYGKLFGAKVSFIAYPFFIPKTNVTHGSIHILAPEDIAVMKVVAISQRGRKRDFIDLHWYVTQREPLIDVLRRLSDQYPSVAHDYHHIAKSLMYFDDAENDPMPPHYSFASWKDIKAYFTKVVPKITNELLLR